MIPQAEPLPLLDVAARSDRGLRRPVNEDAILAADPCFLVADGMGGHEAGDRASRAALAAFGEEFTRPGVASLARIDSALGRARSDVRAISDGAARGAGCTLSGVIRVAHDGLACWYVVNIGDSRVYLQRGEELVRLTRDHSLREELAAAGDPGAASAPGNVITRALGAEDSRHDAWLFPIEAGSRLLVCSDGLTGELDDEQLAGVLAKPTRAGTAVAELLARACAAGGNDNISLVVVDVLAVPTPRAAAAPRDAARETVRAGRS